MFHLLGEVEVVFGFWAVVLVGAMALTDGVERAIAYAESRQFTEPLFVFVVMVVAASGPVLVTICAAVAWAARRLPARTVVAKVWLCLGLIPLVGSLITEPAAMTLAALMLAPLVFRQGIPEPLKYGALGVLFVSISIGGTLTAYAAPHCVRYQSPLILEEALRVGFFLAGLVVLGGMQQWWLQPIVAGLEPVALFFSALGLTAITDNAALTYFGSLIEGMADESKYMLVAVAASALLML